MKNALTAVGIVLLVVLVLLLVGGAGMMGFGGFGMGPGMMDSYGGYSGMMGGHGFNPLGAILSLLLWALVIGGIVLLVVWIVRNADHGKSSIGSRESPLDILKKRYAKGEISKEQFDAIKRDLGS